MKNIEDFFNTPVVFDPTLENINEVKNQEFKFCLDYVPQNRTVLEFGVYKGESINGMSSLRPDIKFVGFDSFTGLPENWDLGGKFISKKKFSLNGKLPPVNTNVTLIKGFYDNTLKNWVKENYESVIHFINIDVDIYSSTKTVLNELNRHILPGTIIRFDELCDWRHLKNITAKEDKRPPKSRYTTWAQHEWKALNEWTTENNRDIEPLARNYCQSSIMQVIK